MSSSKRVLFDTTHEDFGDSEGKVESLQDLPVTTQAWLKKHKKILFEDAKTINAVDVRKTYDQLTNINFFLDQSTMNSYGQR